MDSLRKYEHRLAVVAGGLELGLHGLRDADTN